MNPINNACKNEGAYRKNHFNITDKVAFIHNYYLVSFMWKLKVKIRLRRFDKQNSSRHAIKSQLV